MASAGNTDLQRAFTEFCKSEETDAKKSSKSDGASISLLQVDKWMRQAQVIDEKKITTTDVSKSFNKFKSKTLRLDEFLSFLEELARAKSVELQVMVEKLVSCISAAPTSATTPAAITNGGGCCHGK